MGEARVMKADGGGGTIAEDEVFVIDMAESPNDTLAVALVPSLPHAHEVGVYPDLQTIPFPRMMAGRVCSRILRSSSNDHSRMYRPSKAMTSSKSTVSLLRRTCQRPVMPGLAPRRLRWWLW